MAAVELIVEGGGAGELEDEGGAGGGVVDRAAAVSLLGEGLGAGLEGGGVEGGAGLFGAGEVEGLQAAVDEGGAVGSGGLGDPCEALAGDLEGGEVVLALGGVVGEAAEHRGDRRVGGVVAEEAGGGAASRRAGADDGVAEEGADLAGLLLVLEQPRSAGDADEGVQDLAEEALLVAPHFLVEDGVGALEQGEQLGVRGGAGE